jgi:hypothetical protein
MKKINACFRNGSVAMLCLGGAALVITFTGCSSAGPKQEAVHQRGWIGGEYKTVHVFPKGLKPANHSALLITSLNTNTPAALAGLSEGDLVLGVNHQPGARLKGFRRTIDQSKPGTLITLKTWRDGQEAEHSVRVGRETFTENGAFMVGLPGFFYAPTLWPNSRSFSLGPLGYNREPVSDRKELSSAEARYYQSCNPKDYHLTDPGWKAWLVIMEAQGYKQIKSQEVVPSETGAIEQNEAFGYAGR